VYSFLKCLSAERMEYAEGCYAESRSPERNSSIAPATLFSGAART
jgi:hypothetical protein